MLAGSGSARPALLPWRRHLAGPPLESPHTCVEDDISYPHGTDAYEKGGPALNLFAKNHWRDTRISK